MEEERQNTEEIQKDSGTGVKNPQPSYIPGKPYSKLQREFSEDDLKSPAGQRFLLSEIDRLDYSVNELESYEKNYFILDKENAVLKEKFKTNTANEISYGLFLTIGSAIMGLAPFFWEIGKEYGRACIFIGFLMLIGGILIKYIRWK